MKYPQKYGRPGNSMTYCSDTVMPYIFKTQETDGQRDASFPSRRKTTSDEPKDTEVLTLSSIVAKIYNALLRNRIEPKIENILRKKQNSFRGNRSMASQILTIRWCMCKKPRGNNIICQLRQGLWLYTQRKEEANTTRLRPTQRNRRSHNDAI